MRTMRVAVLAAVLLVAGRGYAGEVAVGEAVIRSDAQSSVKTKVVGPIRRIAAEGTAVRRNEILVEIANEVERAQVLAAQAAVAAAHAELAAARLNLEVAQRELARNLEVEDLVTGKELDVSRDAVHRGDVDVQNKTAALALAQGHLEAAQASLEQTYYRAPFDGLVARRYLQIGDTPKVGETVILDFLSRERLYAEVALPLPLLGRVRAGMRARLELQDVPTGTPSVLNGTVQYVYPELDTTTRMFRVKVGIPAVPASVSPGSFVKIVIPLSPVVR
jgi:RND family efflux transporter MFP subunit